MITLLHRLDLIDLILDLILLQIEFSNDTNV